MAKRRRAKTPSKVEDTPKVGSRVTLMFGGQEMEATVIEDRGNLGFGGRRLLRVRIELEHVDEPLEFELLASEVRSAA